MPINLLLHRLSKAQAWLDGPAGSGKQYLKTGQSLTFQAGKSLCQSKGGYLLQIDSKEEDDFVEQLTLSAETWLNAKNIGADAKGNGPYVWFDGTPMKFSNWGHVNCNYEGAYKDSNGVILIILWHLTVCQRNNFITDMVINSAAQITLLLCNIEDLKKEILEIKLATCLS